MVNTNNVTSKENKITSFAGEWMELEVVLNKISQTQKDKNIDFLSHVEGCVHSHMASRRGTIQKTE